MKKMNFYLTFLFLLFIFSSCSSENTSNQQNISAESSSLNSTALINENIHDLLLCYHGYLKTDTLRSNIYDIKFFGNKNDGVASYIEFSFEFPDYINQSFTYSLENFPHINSIHQGIAVLDINGDNNDDIILDLGENGHQKSAACFIFSPFEHQYIAISDFTTLASPKIAFSSNNELMVISENSSNYLNSPGNNSLSEWSKYKIENANLKFITSLDDISNFVFIF